MRATCSGYPTSYE